MQYAKISTKPAACRLLAGAGAGLGAIAAFAARTAGWHGPGLSIAAAFAVLRTPIGHAAANAPAGRARAPQRILPDELSR